MSQLVKNSGTWDFDLKPTTDLAGAEHVEVLVREDGQTVWVNVDGICRLRVCRVKKLKINDHRKPRKKR